MNWINNLKKIFYILIVNILVFLAIFGVLEISFRMIFPEFKGHVHSEKLTMGKQKHYTDIYETQTRSKSDQSKKFFKDDEKLILIFGDSISDGYGHGFYDIWWKKLEEFLKIKDLNYKFISISGYGNNFTDSIENGESFISTLKSKNKKPYKIIYQFNYNDITPFRNKDLKNINTNFKNYWIEFSKWRYEHLNKSVFARVTQHYLGKLRRKTSGTCYERAYDALSQYSYTFGSKSVQSDSELYWQVFEENITQFSKYLKSVNIDFEILISPILYQIDKERIHSHYNHINLDFTCGTIKPKERLTVLTLKNGIKIYDPENYLRSKFVKRVKDGNFEPFYYTADDNHFTPLASGYIAQFIAENWSNN